MLMRCCRGGGNCKCGCCSHGTSNQSWTTFLCDQHVVDTDPVPTYVTRVVASVYICGENTSSFFFKCTCLSALSSHLSQRMSYDMPTDSFELA